MTFRISILPLRFSYKFVDLFTPQLLKYEKSITKCYHSPTVKQ